MPDWVLDASVVLGILRAEEGLRAAWDLLPGALLSTVNLAECLAWLSRQAVPERKAWGAIMALGLDLAEFDNAQARWTGAVAERARSAGLSLGDRACLALARSRGLPAVTADRAWTRVDLGVKVRLIR